MGKAGLTSPTRRARERGKSLGAIAVGAGVGWGELGGDTCCSSWAMEQAVMRLEYRSFFLLFVFVIMQTELQMM